MGDYCKLKVHDGWGGDGDTHGPVEARTPRYKPGRFFDNDDANSYSTWGNACDRAIFIGHKSGNHGGEAIYLIPQNETESSPYIANMPSVGEYGMSDITAHLLPETGIQDSGDKYVVDVQVVDPAVPSVCEADVPSWFNLPGECTATTLKDGKGAARTYSYIKNSDKDANWEGTKLTTGDTGVPCIGAVQANYFRPNTRRCTYDFTANALKGLYEETKNSSQGRQIFNEIQEEFCKKPNNYNQVVRDDGKQCKDLVTGDQLKIYCEQDDHIKTKSDCWNRSLNYADEIAGTFCEANPTDPWCGCLNVKTLGSSGCNLAENKEIPGCNEINAILNSDTTDTTSKEFLQKSPHCWASACATAVKGSESQYKPSDLYDGCPNELTVCGINVTIGQSAIGSTFNMPQQCGGGDALEPGTADPDDPAGTGDPDRPFYKTSDAFKLTEADTWTDDDKKIVGGGGFTALTSCMSSVLLLILVL